MRTVRVPNFSPSDNGLQFANFFPAEPLMSITVPLLGKISIGDASKGVCGGMAFLVRDLFEHEQRPPVTSDLPSTQSQLFRHLVWRLWQSFNLPFGPLKYYHWMQLPDYSPRPGKSVRWLTLCREWPRIRHSLHQGDLVCLGLVKVRSRNPWQLGNNHQVLCYGYDLDESSGETTLLIYDPNHPNEEITLTLTPSDPTAAIPMEYSTGGTVRGFFMSWYRRKPLPSNLELV